MANTHVSRILLAISLLAAVMLAMMPAAHAQQDLDPPGRVARLNHFSGTVTFSPAGTDDWLRAHVNRPLVAGDRIWAEPGARSELHIGSTAVRLGGRTALGILRLDDDVAQLQLTEGTLNLHVRTLAAGQAYEVATPNLAFSIQEPGTYRIDVAPDDDVTTITVRDGSGVAYGDGGSTVLAEGQQVTFGGTDLEVARAIGNPPFDAFDRWAAGRDRAEDASTAARYVSRDVIGYEQLDAYGSWRDTPQYGMVWKPHRVARDWAPYRSGHWTWISPWGWTWVDDAPWGFAPYHYGRWAYVGHDWCWVPGPALAVVRPVYAPALVVFVGGPNFSLSLASGGSGVGWLPLAPGEPYRPAYRSSPTYVTNINRTVIVQRQPHHDGYRNRHAPHAITAVPAGIFARGGAVMPAAQSVRPERLEHGVVIGAPPTITPAKPAIGTGARMPAPHARHRIFERPVVTVRQEEDGYRHGRRHGDDDRRARERRGAELRSDFPPRRSALSSDYAVPPPAVQTAPRPPRDRNDDERRAQGDNRAAHERAPNERHGRHERQEREERRKQEERRERQEVHRAPNGIPRAVVHVAPPPQPVVQQPDRRARREEAERHERRADAPAQPSARQEHARPAPQQAQRKEHREEDAQQPGNRHGRDRDHERTGSVLR